MSTQAEDRPGALPQKPHLTIRPPRRWAALDLREVWQFRDLLLTLAARDVKLRYRQTALGVLWVILQPLTGAAIFSFTFNKLAKLPTDGMPPFLFAYIGLLGWNVFSGTLNKASGALVQNANLVSKVFFPRLILPLSTVFSTLIDFGVALAMLLLMMPFYHVALHASFLLMPVWLLLILMLAQGIGLAASALTVSYRDVAYVLPVLTQFLLFASPVAYDAAATVPARYHHLYFLNPMAGLLQAFRWSLLGRGAVLWDYVAYAAALAAAVFVCGAFAFKKMERKFADVI